VKELIEEQIVWDANACIYMRRLGNQVINTVQQLIVEKDG
jgi:hypothetical protein